MEPPPIENEPPKPTSPPPILPNPQTSPRNNIWGPWATVGWGILIFIVWCVAQGIPLLMVWALRLHQDGGKEAMSLLESLEEDGDVIGMTTIFGGLIAFGGLWLIIWLRKGAKLPEYLGFHPLKMKTILGVLGISAALCLATDLLTYSLGRDIVPQFMINVGSTCTRPALLILGINLLGPLFEEIYFRGFLFEGLRNSRLGNVGAALLVTLAWASLHIQYDTYEVATVFVGGLLLAYLRLKTGSLWSCILCHLLTNIWATAEAVLYFHGFSILHLSKA
jgi:membrane protease YdiL (CAAX protease family)